MGPDDNKLTEPTELTAAEAYALQVLAWDNEWHDVPPELHAYLFDPVDDDES